MNPFSPQEAAPKAAEDGRTHQPGVNPSRPCAESRLVGGYETALKISSRTILFSSLLLVNG